MLVILLAGCKRDNIESPSAPDPGSNSVTIYATGWETNITNYARRAGIWKNTILTRLTNGPLAGRANAVYVSGNDVYVAGVDEDWNNDVATVKLWKNGVATNLTDGTAKAQANAVYVSGSDVYVAGSVGGFAKYWKNGIIHDLPSTAGTHAKSMVVSGGNV